MSKKLPKYCREQKGNLYYQRDFPTRLYRTYNKKTFKVPLGISASNINEAELLKAIAKASEEFELSCRTMEQTDPALYSDNEIDVLVAKLLREIKLEAGAGANVDHFYDVAEKLVPGLSEALDGSENRPRTIEELVAIKAFHTLEQAARKKPKLLSQLWIEYCEAKNIDVTSRAGKRADQRWKRIFSHIGEQTLDSPSQALDRIHEGLDAYTAERQSAGAKVQSIKREYSDTLSALRAGSKKYRLGWVIEPNLAGTKDDPSNDKAVLTESEQIAVIHHCLSDKENSDIKACVVLMLQSGAMASEIGRLDWKEAKRDLLAEIPQLNIGKGGKTKNRHRVVPIVFGKDYLLDTLEGAIALCAKTVDSNISHRIKKLLVAATGNPALSAHCLRHTLKANGDIANANDSHVAAIGGWAGSLISESQMKYGRDGLVRAEGFRAVRDTSVKMHQHIIESAADNTSNVIQLSNR